MNDLHIFPWHVWGEGFWVSTFKVRRIAGLKGNGPSGQKELICS